MAELLYIPLWPADIRTGRASDVSELLLAEPLLSLMRGTAGVRFTGQFQTNLYTAFSRNTLELIGEEGAA